MPDATIQPSEPGRIEPGTNEPGAGGIAAQGQDSEVPYVIHLTISAPQVISLNIGA